MANTINDIVLSDTAWTDAYAATGYTVGASLLIDNKSNDFILLQIAASSPSASSKDGMSIPPFKMAKVSAGESGCFLKLSLGSGPCNIQLA